MREYCANDDFVDIVSLTKRKRRTLLRLYIHTRITILDIPRSLAQTHGSETRLAGCAEPAGETRRVIHDKAHALRFTA